MLELELSEGERVVAENEYFVAFVPYAAISPFHLWVLPRRHGPTFLDQNPAELLGLAQIMRELLGKLYWGLKDPDYNYILRSAPNRDSSSGLPALVCFDRASGDAGGGFRAAGSGMYINPTLPEESARFLRDQDPGKVCSSPFPTERNHPGARITRPS